MDKNQQIHSLIDSVIIVSEKFISKVANGRAISTETYFDLEKLKNEAILLRAELEKIDKE